jgi:hypothetical protein
MNIKNILVVCTIVYTNMNCIGQVSGNIIGLYGRYTDLTTTNPVQEAFGIGEFGVGAADLPKARLHINSFRMGSSSDNTLGPFSEGFLIRTDGNQADVNQWSLWTGTTATLQTMKFRLYADAVPAPDIAIQSLSGGLRFETNGQTLRMRLNGASISTINNFNINNSGFLGLCSNQVFWTDPNSVKSPYSLLHLAGSGANYQQAGYRPWMVDGITFTTNSDLGYIGPRAIQNDVTEFVFAWSDNASGAFGPDDMVFRFLSSTGTGTGSASSEGLEIMRCVPDNGGKVGIGDEFDLTAANRPQQRLHVHDPGTNNTSDAQMRLSQNFANSFADFRVTNNGNLYLNMTGTQGRLGIEEPAPLEMLDVNGNARIQNIPLLSPNCVLLGHNTAGGGSSDNTLTRLDLTNDPTTYLAGDGTWQTITGGDCDWDIVTNIGSNDLVMGYAGACNDGNTGIGTQNPSAKLDVFKNVPGTTANQKGLKVTLIGGTLESIGADVLCNSPVVSSSTQTIGIRGIGQGSHSKNFGGYFQANSVIGSQNSVGVYGATGLNNVYGTVHMGVQGSAINGKYNVGVYGSINTNVDFVGGNGVSGNATSGYDFNDPFSGRQLFGVAGRADANMHCGYNAVGVYGIVSNVPPGCQPGYAGYFVGNVFVDGNIVANNLSASDEMLKENINTLHNGLGIISQLNPVSYNFRVNEFPNLHLDDGLRCGFIAQQAELILPGITKEVASLPQYNDEGDQIAPGTTFHAMDYSQLHAVEIAAIQELLVIIDSLKSQINECCSASVASASARMANEPFSQDITLKDFSSIVLNQNVPNPFAEKTTIHYTIDVDFSKAQILFYDQAGHLIQSSDIKTKGDGYLNIFADDLSSGMYSYALVVDGKIIQTRKMVKE